VSPEESLPQAIRVSGPSNDQGAIAWHFAADWGIHSDGRDFSRGAFVVENLRSYGSSLTLSPPSIKSSSYIVFGASIGVEVGSTSIMPLGRDNEIGQLSFSGINVGAVDGGAWTIATLGNQPGILKAVSDGNDPYLEFNISWPENGKAAMGKISVDNIDLFGATGLGGFGVIPAPSRIGFAVDRVQLQYLNIKLRP
jgi:hypothetical protein